MTYTKLLLIVLFGLAQLNTAHADDEEFDGRVQTGNSSHEDLLGTPDQYGGITTRTRVLSGPIAKNNQDRSADVRGVPLNNTEHIVAPEVRSFSDFGVTDVYIIPERPNRWQKITLRMRLENLSSHNSSPRDIVVINCESIDTGNECPFLTGSHEVGRTILPGQSVELELLANNYSQPGSYVVSIFGKKGLSNSKSISIRVGE